MKNYLLVLALGSILVLNACTTATADTDLKWHHKDNEGQAVNHVAGEVDNINHTPQEAVDKINTLYEGSVIEVELDKDDGVYYYEIEIVNGEVKYDSKVNADNLEIIKLEKGEADSGESDAGEKHITPDAAFDIAMDEVNGDVLSWELDDNEYEIIMENEDELIKVEIDALSGEAVSVNVQNDERNSVDGSGGAGDNDEDGKTGRDEKNAEKSDEDKASEESPSKEEQSSDDSGDENADENNGEEQSEQSSEQKQQAEPEEKNQQQNSNGLLTPQEAMNLALHTVGGIVIEWEYDDEDFEYEIELNVNGQEVEVEIDSRNGAILDVDYD